MNETVDQDAEEESAVDPRSVDGRRLVAEQHAGNADDQRCCEPGQCAVGEIILAQRREREHAISHREGNGDGGRHQATNNVIACLRQPFQPRILQMNPKSA